MAAGTAVGTRFGRVESPMPASELKKKAQQAYIRADNAQVVVKPEFLDDVASTLRNKARSEGFVPKMQPAIDAALEEIDLNKAQYKTLGDLDCEELFLQQKKTLITQTNRELEQFWLMSMTICSKT